MKAYVLQNTGNIKLKNVSKPEPKEGEVIVRVRACGICGSDIPRIYQNGAHKMPLILGHEFSGEVTELGKDVSEKFLGQRVGVFPLIPCGECAACKKQKYEVCRNYSYLGSRRDGGFAEYVAVPAENLVWLPDTISFATAAMLEPMAVAVHAMQRVLPCKEDKITICGLGTIGLLLIMVLKEAGYKNVFVIGNKDFQKAVFLKMGLSEDCFFDSRKSRRDVSSSSEELRSWLMERTDGLGADIFFECVGKNETISDAINLVAVSGKVCLVGNPFSDIELSRDIYWKILRNQLTVTGTWNSSFMRESGDDWHYVIERLADYRLMPEELITHRFPMERFGEGLRIMRDRAEDYIKIMGIF